MADSVRFDDPTGEQCPDYENPEESQSPQSKSINTGNSDAGVDELPLNFSQLRQKFEEKCKPKLKYITPPLIRDTQTSDEEQGKAEASSEFQKLYQIFKEYFTKRQFAAIETCFNLADADQDGFLEPKEVKQLMIDCQQPVNLSEADIIVSLGDHDQDGKLSAKEFLELCKPSAEVLREHHHMEGSRPPPNEEFALVLMERLRSFASPVNSRVKGTRQFFENMIGSSRTSLCNNVKDTGSAQIPKNRLNKKYKPHTCAHHMSEDEAKKSLESSQLPNVETGGIVVLEETVEERSSCQFQNPCC